MLDMIQYWGLDLIKMYVECGVGFGFCWFVIIDLVGGDQLLMNEDGLVWFVFNGEIYNYCLLCV